MWITEFRARHGLELDVLGTLIRRYGARKNPPMRVSDGLLYRLETDGNFRTVPALADLIAEACGATTEERNAMVLERYRERPVPAEATDATPPVILMLLADALAKDRGPRGPIVTVDKAGNVLRRYASIVQAAFWCNLSTDAVGRRVRREAEADEFRLTGGFTFRDAAEWDAMTPPERRRDLTRTLTSPHNAPRRGRGGAYYHKPVTVVEIDGTATHYPSVNDAAAGAGLTPTAISNRLKKGLRDREGRRYMYTAEWEALRQGTGNGVAASRARHGRPSESRNLSP